MMAMLLLAIPLQLQEGATKLFTAASAVKPALDDILSLPKEVRPYIRYISFYNTPATKLPAYLRVNSFVVNSLSDNVKLLSPPIVAGSDNRLVRVDLSHYKIDPKSWDKLGRVGSGRAPFPEPYFHYLIDRVVAEVREEYWPGGYEDGKYYPPGNYTREISKTRKRVLGNAPWLPKEAIAELCSETDSEFPIYRADWFMYYSLLEPRYHELIGVDDDLKSVVKLAAVKLNDADEEGVSLRGVVLDSEVAPNNRALDRRPTILLYGDGYYWNSNDFDASIKNSDAIADPLIKPQAQEIIFSRRNGLQGYFLVDENEKRLDRADTKFARDRRNNFRHVEVEIRNCFICHASGIIPVKDVVRSDSDNPYALALRDLEKHDKVKAKKVAERFFAKNLADLVTKDQTTYSNAVKACNGYTAEANALALYNILIDYEKDVTLDTLVYDTGFPRVTVLGVLERAKTTTLDHSASRLARKDAKSRRDQYEALGHGQLMNILNAVPVIEQPPPNARTKK